MNRAVFAMAVGVLTLPAMADDLSLRQNYITCERHHSTVKKTVSAGMSGPREVTVEGPDYLLGWEACVFIRDAYLDDEALKSQPPDHTPADNATKQELEKYRGSAK